MQRAARRGARVLAGGAAALQRGRLQGMRLVGNNKACNASACTPLPHVESNASTCGPPALLARSQMKAKGVALCSSAASKGAKPRLVSVPAGCTANQFRTAASTPPPTAAPFSVTTHFGKCNASAPDPTICPGSEWNKGACVSVHTWCVLRMPHAPKARMPLACCRTLPAFWECHDCHDAQPFCWDPLPTGRPGV